MLAEFTIRPARAGDEHGIFALILALAEYEQLLDNVTGSAEKLGLDLFGQRPAAEAVVVEEAGQLVAFALFFSTYSTFLSEPGLYLEDIFVLPAQRRRGIGKALLKYVARVASERGCRRLQWSVLEWNASAIAFYESLGASLLPDSRICRVSGGSLAALAAD